MKRNTYASFWLRLIAYIIDAAVIALLASGLSLLFFLVTFPDSLTGIVLFLGVWLYYAFMESSKYQGTLGKFIVEIKVTDLKGKPITFARASARYFGKFISGFLLCVGFIMILFTKKKQGLHDLISDSLVVRTH